MAPALGSRSHLSAFLIVLYFSVTVNKVGADSFRQAHVRPSSAWFSLSIHCKSTLRCLYYDLLSEASRASGQGSFFRLGSQRASQGEWHLKWDLKGQNTWWVSCCGRKGPGDGNRDQCVGNRNRETCSDKSDKVARLSDISEHWLHVRITWGNFSSNLDMLGSTPDPMNWNVLQWGSNLSVFGKPPGSPHGVCRVEKLSYAWATGSGVLGAVPDK